MGYYDSSNKDYLLKLKDTTTMFSIYSNGINQASSFTVKCTNAEGSRDLLKAGSNYRAYSTDIYTQDGMVLVKLEVSGLIVPFKADRFIVTGNKHAVDLLEIYNNNNTHPLDSF